MKKAFTLTELLISMGILALVSGMTYVVFTDILRQGEISKEKIQNQSLAGDLYLVLKSKIKNAEQALVTPSSLGVNFSNLILRNGKDSEEKEIFSVIKAFSDGEKLKFGIFGFNPFQGVNYDENEKKIYFSNTGKGRIEFFDLKNKKSEVLVEGLKNPTDLLVFDEFLIFSESGDQTVKKINKENKEVEILLGNSGEVGFENLLNKPKGLAKNGEVIFISDSKNKVVRALNLENLESKILLGEKVGDKDFFELEIGELSDLAFSKELEALFLVDTEKSQITACKLQNEEVEFCKKIAGNGEGFSGDFSLAYEAQLKNPIGITLATEKTLYVTDSGNNLIRKIYCPRAEENLLDCGNLIKTVIGNSAIKTLHLGKDQKPDTQDDLKISTKAPHGGFSEVEKLFDGGLWKNEAKNNTEVLLNLPSGLTLVDSSLVFLDGLNGSLRTSIFEWTGEESLLFVQNPVFQNEEIKEVEIKNGRTYSLKNKEISLINTDFLSTQDQNYQGEKKLEKMFFEIKDIGEAFVNFEISILNQASKENEKEFSEIKSGARVGR